MVKNITVWPQEYIGNIFDFKNGLNKAKEFFGSGIPIVNYVDVYSRDAIYKNTVKGRVDLTLAEINRFRVKRGDVFFTRTSETPEEVGIAAVLLEEISDCVFSGFVLRARPKKQLLLPEYCQYCFQTQQVRAEIILGCTYTTRALTNGTQLSKIQLPIPPLPEQKAIAEALSDIDHLIVATEKLIAKKKDIKKGLMQELMTCQCRLTGFASKWLDTPLSALCKIKKGEQLNKATLSDQGDFYVLNGGTEPSGFTDSWNTPSNTISISEGGNSCGFVKFNSKPFWSGGHCYTLTSKNSVDNRFLYQFLKYSQSEIMGLRIGTGLPNIQRKSLEDFSCHIPLEVKEQKAIANILFDADYELEELDKKLKKLQLIKSGMMSELLTGRIRLTEKQGELNYG